MKRVLIFSLAYYPHVGGAEVSIKEITDRISPDDISFDMVTLRFAPEDREVETIGNVRVHRIKGLEWLGYVGKIVFPLCAAVRAYRLHKRTPYDGAWAMMSYMVLPLVLLRVAGVRLQYVLNLQEGDPFRHMFSRIHVLPFRALLNRGFAQAAVIQTLSTHLAGWARRMGYTGQIEIIPNAADTRRFSEAAPIEVGRAPGEVWLVTSSRLVHKNAVDDVINALPLLPSSVKFLVLGDGPEEASLKGLADRLGVGARVVFKGYVSHAELPGYLKASDIFVRPSRSEGFGASFVEAMAAGLPVIATQEGGIADFLYDAERNPGRPATGWAVDKDSPVQIAAAVKRILDNKDAAAQVVAHAQKQVFEKYDWNRIAGAMREKVFPVIFA